MLDRTRTHLTDMHLVVITGDQFYADFAHLRLKQAYFQPCVHFSTNKPIFNHVKCVLSE